MTAPPPQPAVEMGDESLQSPNVAAFHDPRTGSLQYVVSAPDTGDCAIIDPVLDFDEKSGGVATTSADRLLEYVRSHGLRLQWILDTHPHADHLTAADYLKRRTGAPTAIGARITAVQKLWADIYDLPSLATDGSQWDRLFDHGDAFEIGRMPVRVLFSPGHTLASITYLVGDAAFIHDTLFMPDSGTARADFPGGDPDALWNSIQDILALPRGTRLFTGHDYRPGGREARWQSSIAEQKTANIHLPEAISRDDFISFRKARDAGLPMPRLILHALQVNINAGRLPELERNGRRYLKFPLDALSGAAWN